MKIRLALRRFSSEATSRTLSPEEIMSSMMIRSLPVYVGTEELMGNDGVASIDNLRVVSSLIEHTHVQTKNVGNVDGTSHTAFIRADDHHVVAVNLKIRNVA